MSVHAKMEFRKALDDLEIAVSCDGCKRRPSLLYFIGTCDDTFCEDCIGKMLDGKCPTCKESVMPDVARRPIPITEVVAVCDRLRKLSADDNENKTETTVDRDELFKSYVEDNALFSTPMPENGVTPSVSVSSSSTKKSTKPKKSSKRKSAADASILKTSPPTKIFAAHSSPYDRVNATGETFIHIASKTGDLGAVKEYLATGRDPNVVDNGGWTPLHEATFAGYAEIVEILLNSGAVVDAVGDEFITPLHAAVIHERADIAKILLRHGADWNAKTIYGKTAVDMAELKAGSAEIKEALNEAKCVVNRHVASEIFRERQRIFPIIICGSGLDKNQTERMKKFASIFGEQVKFSSAFNVKKTTHLVVGKNPPDRSAKYLKAILKGRWIIYFNWVDGCLEEKRILDENNFEVQGSKVEASARGPQRARENFLLLKPPLFAGCEIYLAGLFTSSVFSINDIKELVTLGHGKLLKRPGSGLKEDDGTAVVPYHAETSWLSNTLIVSDDGTNSKTSRVPKEIHRVPLSWFINCIDHHRLLPFPNSG